MIKTLTERTHCARCSSKMTDKAFALSNCNVTVSIPLCDDCLKHASYRLSQSMLPLLKLASETVNTNYLLGYMEAKEIERLEIAEN